MREGQKRGLARKLRRDMTEAERQLWYRLRDRRLLGCKFRRQWPVGPYVADFACLEHRLILELDGSQHLNSAHDGVRDEFLRRQGFAVLRFWNNDVLAKTDDVCDAILRWLSDRSSILSPSRENPEKG
ncbi:DUF559 domain-containing protein [Stenotrophomonas sp. MMGLT7]|uniref:endonuclease domain-containing protein n=1 Tax=Stenotrophomonas sp. MMGLT7 TaxID=2901227 RepID=UPI001E52D091|nr:DUF559 domain-containing protein [Stenotrophomonas sp. MMGLT7]